MSMHDVLKKEAGDLPPAPSGWELRLQRAERQTKRAWLSLVPAACAICFACLVWFQATPPERVLPSEPMTPLVLEEFAPRQFVQPLDAELAALTSDARRIFAPVQPLIEWLSVEADTVDQSRG